ncbi:MAG: hypothetical protein AAFV53_15550 [Myxococcota bacterium]
MDRDEADHPIWQHTPIHIIVDADAFLSVHPFLPLDITVTQQPDGAWGIVGMYGMDTFRDDRFVLLVDGQQRTFHRWEDIPDQIDNVIAFLPDATHDQTFQYTFEKAGQTFIHRHWVHHDTTPWKARLRALVARETNGGWSARHYPHRRPRHPSLLRDDARGRITRHLLQWKTDLPSG